MTTFDLLSHERHEYLRLLDVLPWMTTTVSFVLRDMGDLTDVARLKVLDALQPHVIERKTVAEWPGTRLIGHTAELLTCGNVRAVVEVMRQHAASFYEWLSPLPEDPAFYRADGSVLLGSIAHERGVFVKVTDDEQRLFRLAGVRLHSREPMGQVTSSDEGGQNIKTLPSRDASVPDREFALRLLAKRIDNANHGERDEQSDWPHFSDTAASELHWLTHWYCAQSDGQWEHDHGITIETLDNPGWTMRIDLTGTERETATWDGPSVERGEHDWYFCRITDWVFEIACGPLNLDEGVRVFREWWEGESS